jgi:hypothetical protein
MLRRIRFKPLLALNGSVDFLWRNGALFHDSMSQNRRHRTMEEIENPVMDALQTRTEFVDSIPQQIRLRPPQFVPQFAEPLHPQKAFRLYLYRQLLVFGILSQSIRNLAKNARPQPITSSRSSSKSTPNAFCEEIAGGGAVDHAGDHALDARGCAFGRVGRQRDACRRGRC